MNYNPFSKHALPPNKPSNKNKSTIGVLLAIFLGISGLIIGLLLYPVDTEERKTFLKSWSITFPIIIISLIILIIVFYNNLLTLLTLK